MRPYQNIKFTEGPDAGDIREEGRKSSVGRILRGQTFQTYKNTSEGVVWSAPKIRHNDRGYNNPVSKAAIRRYLKRVDRAISARFDQKAES